MSKFTVRVREVHVRHVEVEATSASEALRMVDEDEVDCGDEAFCEYSHTLPNDSWDVSDADGNLVEVK